MVFGQPLGPPASGRQMRELLELVEQAGHAGLRDARGPLALTQRQAAGKFTRDEADALIAALQRNVSGGEDTEAGDAPAPQRFPAAERLPAAERAIRALPTEALAAELQRRGWVVLEP